MTDIDKLPEELRSTLVSVRDHLENDIQNGHVEWIDRVRLWKTMIETHGTGASDCRRAVLAAMTTWPLIPIWEEFARQYNEILPTAESLTYPRMFLRDCIGVFLKRLPPLEFDEEIIRRRQLEDMYSEAHEPVSATLMAVLWAGNFLLCADENNVTSEYDAEIWNLVVSGEYSDHAPDRVDWDDVDCFNCAADAWSGNLITGDFNAEIRKRFWRQFLNDFVTVNTLSLEEVIGIASDLVR